MPDDPIRTSEAERDRAIASLSNHFALGRLSLDELNQRVDRALQAKTRNQLGTLLLDLPVESAAPPQPAIRSDVTHSNDPLQRTAWAPWAFTAITCLVIWVATSLAEGAALYFWPAWVIGPWGAAAAARSLRHDRSADLRRGCPF